MADLRDGTTVDDRRLDRLIQFDEASRGYPIRTLVAGKKPRSYSWRIIAPWGLIDQMAEGACAGFAETNELIARPMEKSFESLDQANRFARDLYHEAQHGDPWDGCYLGARCPLAPSTGDYDGTSILAVIKAAQQRGHFKAYRWSFSLHDLVLGVGYEGGPALIGIWWYDTNYTPDANGFIRPQGNKVGGHAILVRAVRIIWHKDKTWETHGWDAVDLDRSYFILRNSWGPWGIDNSGDCFVTLRDMGTWLADDGEAAFMVGRQLVA
jgi:hypothetical protein